MSSEGLSLRHVKRPCGYIEEGAEPEGNEPRGFVLAIERRERRCPTRVDITTTAQGHKGINVPPEHDVW